MKRHLRIWIYSIVLVGAVLMLLSSCKKSDNNNEPEIVKDIDGNVYHTVIIGKQVWMVENLKTTKFNDGIPIPLVTDNISWHFQTPAYCWYDNDVTNKNIFGAMYNWFAVDPNINNGKNIAPIGWHVASDSDWAKLTDFLKGDSIAGGKLKAIGITFWNSPNTGANDLYGFKALPGGYRTYMGEFYYKGDSGYWWTSSTSTRYNFDALMSSLNYLYKNIFRPSDGYGKQYGMSVRCIKD